MGLEVELESGAERSLVRVCGDVDLNSSPTLRKTLLKAIPKARNEVAIDLRNVGYMDSSGVATLVEALKMCDQQSLPLVLADPSLAVLKVLQLSRLDQVFTIRTKEV